MPSIYLFLKDFAFRMTADRLVQSILKLQYRKKMKSAKV